MLNRRREIIVLVVVAAALLSNRTAAVAGDDPAIVETSTYLGGIEADWLQAVAIGPDGSAYLAGSTSSPDLPTTAGAFQTDPGVATCPDECVDAFVVKLTSDGLAIDWATYLGGSRVDRAWTLLVDELGFVYVAGHSNSADFPLVEPWQQEWAGGSFYGDAFVTKLLPDGSDAVFSTYLGGAGGFGDVAFAMDFAPDAGLVLGGYTDSRDFPTTEGAFIEDCVVTETFACGGDGFVARLRRADGVPTFATLIGGTDVPGQNGRGTDEVLGLSVTPSGDVVVAGHTTSINFPTTSGAHDTDYGGLFNELFVARLDASGTSLEWGTYLGGGHFEEFGAVGVDAAEHAYVVATTESTDYPVTAGALDTTCGTGEPFCGNHFDAVLTGVAADGSDLVYSTYLGGGLSEAGTALVVDPDGTLTVVGGTKSSDFPQAATVQAGNRSEQCFQWNCSDAFVTTLVAPDYDVTFSTLYGGTGRDVAEAVAEDGAGRLVVGGLTASSDFPVRAPVQLTCAGPCEYINADVALGDAFVTRFVRVPFRDIGLSSFAPSIAWMAAEGIAQGCSPTAFCPTAFVTRGQMASFLSRALDLPATGTDHFADDDGTTHEAAINRVAEAGITAGCAPGRFCPTAFVTRGQMAAFLYRALAD